MIMGNKNMEKKAKLYYVDTTSNTAYIKAEDLYSDLVKDVETRFDTSNCELEKSLP